MDDLTNKWWKRDVEDYYKLKRLLSLNPTERMEKYIKDRLSHIEKKYPNVKW